MSRVWVLEVVTVDVETCVVVVVPHLVASLVEEDTVVDTEDAVVALPHTSPRRWFCHCGRCRETYGGTII